MKRLIQGVHKFQNGAFHRNRELYLKLSKQQNPHTLFVTCSDSRVIPNLITQSEPGDIFVIRNAGNMIPPYSEGVSGEGATLEYAVRALSVKEIVVCGHSECGAMRALVDPTMTEGLPLVRSWLKNASRTAEIMATQYETRPEEDRLNIAIQENVLVQLENIKTYPFIAEEIEREGINLYAWVYKIPTGEVYQFDYEVEQFIPLEKPTEDNSEFKVVSI